MRDRDSSTSLASHLNSAADWLTVYSVLASSLRVHCVGGIREVFVLEWTADVVLIQTRKKPGDAASNGGRFP